MADSHVGLFSDVGFMPHGMCYLWRPGILSLHVVSDAMIALAYFSIPFTLVYFVRKRRDLEFDWMFLCFAVFIVACGATHVMEIWVVWEPAYWLSGTIKAVTAMASVPTAVLLVRLIPDALQLPSPSALRRANTELEHEIVERKRAEAEVRRINEELEGRVEERTAQLESINRSLLQEVGERKRIEQGLRESESMLRASQQLLQAIVNNSTAVVYVKDVDGRYLMVNRRFEELFHLPERSLWGKTDHDIFPKDTADAFRAVDRQALASDDPIQAEEMVPLDDGLHTYVSIKCRLYDAEGKPYAVCGISTDITERKRGDERFRLALEAAPTGMLMVDTDGHIVLVNEQIEKLFGYTRAELIGMPVERLVPPRFREHHPAFRATFFAAPQARAMGAGRDLYGLRKDGTEVPIEIGLNPFSTPQGLFVLSSIVDITERRRSVEQLRERSAALAESLAERDVLLQEIHHRVKNNLQVISSLINMQARKVEMDSHKELLKDCKNRVDAIALIHEQLYQSRDYARVPFSEYVKRLASNVVRAAEESSGRIALRMNIEQIALPVDKAIPCGLILNELITNALKHAFPGERRGAIRVELRLIPEDCVQLAVSDDGIGIPDSASTAHRASIGMQLVATLTDQLEGKLTIVREGGTSLRVEFPLRRELH
jgi:PAS domain S-box-containing protein